MKSLDAIVRTLGEPKALWRVQSGSRTVAAVARWRHRGAVIDLSDADAYQVIFNVSGGQVVTLPGHVGLGRTIRAGAVGINAPEQLGAIHVLGRADTLQIFISREWIETVNGSGAVSGAPQLAACAPQLRTAAARALVAIEQSCGEGDEQLDEIVRAVARYLVTTPPTKSEPGGLAPSARRRVGRLLSHCVAEGPGPAPRVDQMARAAGLSTPHFARAFHRTEGLSPHACLIGRRLDMALVLLLRADARVDRVSDMSGFSSASHFVSTFKSHMGITPGAFRDAARSPV